MYIFLKKHSMFPYGPFKHPVIRLSLLFTFPPVHPVRFRKSVKFPLTFPHFHIQNTCVLLLPSPVLLLQLPLPVLPLYFLGFCGHLWLYIQIYRSIYKSLYSDPHTGENTHSLSFCLCTTPLRLVFPVLSIYLQV